MKLLTFAFLLAASAVAAAERQRQELYERNYGWQWAIGNQDAGNARTWEGGDLRAPTIEEGHKRRPGPARYEDVRCSLNAKVEPVVQEWLRGALDGEHPARDINLVELKRDRSPGKATLFQNSKITEIVIPVLHADEADVEANVAIKFAPASVQVLAQAPAIAGGGGGGGGGGKAGGRAPRAFTNRFLLAIDGLGCEDVVKVGSITARIPPESAPQVSNIVLTVAEHSGTIAGWKAWFDSFVVQGNNGDAQEKNGTLEIGDRGTAPLLTLAFKGLGIVRMSRINMTQQGSAGAVAYHEVELYCEGLSIKTAGASPTAPSPPEKDPAAANREDKGTRDPEGVPRFPECVRTSFTGSKSKFQNDERADYVTKSAHEKVDAYFAEQMKELKWKESSRDESGSLKDASYKLDQLWMREKQTARVVIGKLKDGTTTIYWQVVTPNK